MLPRVTLDVCGIPVEFRHPNGLEDAIAATGTLPRLAIDTTDAPAADLDPAAAASRILANINIATVMICRCSQKPKIVPGCEADPAPGVIYADEIPSAVKLRLFEELMRLDGAPAEGQTVRPFSGTVTNS